jgi:putative oxidoreductase
MISASFTAAWSPRLLSVMRIMLAFLFMQHGGQKLFDFPVAKAGPAVEIFSLIGMAGVLELFGGLLLLLGLFTRSVAFVLSGLMAVAYFMAHAPKGLLPIVNHGELAVLYCFAFLYLAMAGGGTISLDQLCERKKRNKS